MPATSSARPPTEADLRVLLTRPRADSESLARELIHHGHAVMIDPMLRIVPVPPIAPPAPARYRGVILTSAQAARHAPVTSLGLPAFAVGEATARAARAAGFKGVIAAQGDARSLAQELAASAGDDARPFLHLCGAEVREGTAEAFAEAGIAAERCVVYRAVPSAALSARTRTAMTKDLIDAVVLFSPRTARIFLGLVDAAGLGQALARMQAITWSEAIAEAALPARWARVSTVDRRDRATLLGLLRGADGG
jgi:uroporphyrinogen-III synthase